MREILFRGKSEDGKWLEGDLFQNKSRCYIRYPENDTYYTHDRVIPETVGQYTGLTDKNGKKIFEGDIIQFDYIGKNLGVNGKASVLFENGKFGVLWGWHNEFVCLDGFSNTTLEVIGNIHDNPKLMNEGDVE